MLHRRPSLGAMLACTSLLLASCPDPDDSTGGAGGAAPSGGGGSGAGSSGGAKQGGASVGGSAEGGAGGHGGGQGGQLQGGQSQGGDGGEGGGAIPDGTKVRIVAANLTSGNLPKYDDGPGIRILKGLDADIVLIQEFNYLQNNSASFTTFVTDVCGAECTYVRGPTAEIPNGVISRYPMLASGSWADPEVSNRSFVWAHIDAPGDVDLWAISVHLLTSNATDRREEAEALMSFIDANVADADFAVLGGDFNTNQREEPALDVLDPYFVTTGPYPADHTGNAGTSGNRRKPYDWVIGDGQLDSLAIPVELGQSTFPWGAVVDTRVYEPLRDISPAQEGDSAAFQMQHMAVVRDFALPR